MRRAPCEVPHGGTDERREARKRDGWVLCKAMADVGQRDQAVVAVHVHGQDARSPHMKGRQRQQRVA